MLPLILILSLLTTITTQPTTTPKKIALLHLHDNAPFFAELGALTLSSKRRYARRHSYELVYHTPTKTSGLWEPATCTDGERRGKHCYKPANSFVIDPRAPTFGKIKLARAACIGRDGYWLLWSDADAMPVNHSTTLESVVDDRYDLGVTADWLMINAGIILLKCSSWTKGFLKEVYEAREFDKAMALDQSAFQHFFEKEEVKRHVYYIPKRLLNVYVEEYQPGDFFLHMAGKLYEATVEGALAIAHQFDVLSYVEDIEDLGAFFGGRYLLGMYSGICRVDHGGDSQCSAEDERRLKLDERLLGMSFPDRYRHVGMRYYWLKGWKDVHDFDGWDDGRKVFGPEQDGVHDEL